MPKEDQDFRGISLKRELVEQVEKFVEENPEYKSKADFIHEATRLRLQELKKMLPLPRFEHFNINDNGVRISDRKLNMIADIFIKPTGVFCELDQSNNCEHIKFALTVQKIRDNIRKHKKEGWKLPDV